MKRKYKALLSSACIVVASGAIIVGSTYALFTDSSSVNIAVTSGNVEVKAYIDDINTYSAKARNKLTADETYSDLAVGGDAEGDDSKYVYQKNETSVGSTKTTSNFSIGGGLEYDSDTNKFTVSEITPGTKITFNINIENSSNVNIKYRTSIKYTAASGLLDALNFTLDDWVPVSEDIVKYDDANKSNSIDLSTTKSINSLWDSWDYDADDSTHTKTVRATVELPIDVTSDYMDKTVELEYTVEAVQGNASTISDEQQEFFINSANGLKSAIAVGGNVDVYKNITLSNTDVSSDGIGVQVNKNATVLNMDTAKLSFDDSQSESATSLLTSSKNLIIHGDGRFDTTNTTSGKVLTVKNGSTAVITGGTFTSNDTVINVEDGGTLIISGGTFQSINNSANLITLGTATAATQQASVNAVRASADVKSPTLIIAGGTFVGFNPEEYLKNNNYSVSSSNGTYVVSYSSTDENGNTTIKEDDTYTYDGTQATSISLAEKIVIDSSYTTISSFAFSNYYPLVTEVVLPSSITTIETGAFTGCSSLTTIDLANTKLTTINSNAFNNCSSLTTLTLPESVTTIGGYAFQSCTSLKEINIPSGITSLGNSVFEGCSSLTSITIPESVTTIGAYTFNGCDLKTITLPSNLTSLGDHALASNTSLESITIPAKVENIYGYAFCYCTSLQSITFASDTTLKSLGDLVFYGCTSLSSITIPSSVESIGSKAFYGCTSLDNVVLPYNIKSIGTEAFNSCKLSSLSAIGAKVESLGNDIFAYSKLSALTIDCHSVGKLTDSVLNAVNWGSDLLTITITGSDTKSNIDNVISYANSLTVHGKAVTVINNTTVIENSDNSETLDN